MMIRLRLFGPLALELGDGTSVASVLAQPKRLALLACLAAVHPPGSLSRDALVAWLWPELDEERARKGLRQALFGLRRSLGGETFSCAGDERIAVNPACLWCDVAGFSAAVERGADAEALSLYRGPFLDGFHLADAPEFERWVERERHRLQQEAVRAAWRLARSAESGGDRLGVRRWAELAVELAPYDEEGFRAYLGVLGRQADRAAAVAAFAAYRQQMAEDLGLEPSAETVAMIERIRQDAASFAAADLYPKVAMSPPRQSPAGHHAAERDVVTPRPEEGPMSVQSRRSRAGWQRRYRGRIVARIGGIAVVSGVVALFGWRALAARSSGAAPGSDRGARADPMGVEARTNHSAAMTPTASVIRARSIAVLPFENLSANPENAYLAAGIQNQILTDLTHVSELQVISRESVMPYAGHPAPAEAISRRLRVANLLEGSIQRAGRRIRVSVQLIDARRDAHVWAATYDREVSDVFAVESDIARRITGALKAKLTPEEALRLATPPTAVPAAYQAYLRGLASESADQLDGAHLQAAADAFHHAVDLDSTFALAWARLSEVQSLRYFLYERTPERLAASRWAAERAVALAPDAAETHLAMGRYYYQGRRDYGRARAEFERALLLLPNDADEWASLSYVERRQGDWTHAIEHAKHALLLNPLNHFLLSETADTYIALRRFAPALELLDRALEAYPGDPASLTDEAAVYDAVGDFQRAAAVLANARIPPTSRFDFTQLVEQRLYMRDYAGAIRILQAGLASPGLSVRWPLGRGVLLEQLAFAEELSGDTAAARADYARARLVLAARLAEEPDDPGAYAWLGRAEAGLGHRDAALTAGRRAVSLLPPTTDALWGPGYEENLARIQARVGDADAAIGTIRRLLAVPYSDPFTNMALTPALLRADPAWDRLRRDRRFRALVADGHAYPAALLPGDVSGSSPRAGSTRLRGVEAARARAVARGRAPSSGARASSG